MVSRVIKMKHIKLRVRLKSTVAAKVLSPLRSEILALIHPNASLLEVGSGTGDLLLLAAPKIRNGLGLDLDDAMVDFSESKRLEAGLENIRFSCNDISAVAIDGYDISTSSLCLHEMPSEDACAILQMMLDYSDEVIIADFSKAPSFFSRLSIEFDELISGHYLNFRAYKKCGGISGYAKKLGATVKQEMLSSVSGISIWVITQ